MTHEGQSRNEEYNVLRTKFLQDVCQINSVANIMGKGRDDFEIEILIQAENLSEYLSSKQNNAVKQLADQISQTFMKIRTLIRKYNDNIEVVDPMLKNNKDLVDLLVDFEQAWTLGKEHILDTERCQ